MIPVITLSEYRNLLILYKDHLFSSGEYIGIFGTGSGTHIQLRSRNRAFHRTALFRFRSQIRYHHDDKDQYQHKRYSFDCIFFPQKAHVNLQ